MEVYTQSISHELAQRGHKVSVVTCGIGNVALRETVEDGVEIWRMPAADPIGRYPILKRSKTAAKLWADLEKQDFDAIVVNTRFYSLSLRMLKLACRKQIRPILIEHGSGYLTFGNLVLDAPVHLYEKAIAARVRKARPLCYGVSREASTWLEHFGLKSSGVIHNSIDVQAFRAQSSHRDFRSEYNIALDANLVAFTGRITPEKGIWVLERAARKLENENIFFLVAGEGADLDKLRETAPSNLKALGRLNRSDVAALLETADVFCFPSESEGLPTSVLEAAACEAYIVATPVGGISEIIPDDKHGTILKSVSESSSISMLSTECADALKSAFADVKTTRVRARTCRERIEREFSWAKAADDLLLACGEC